MTTKYYACDHCETLYDSDTEAFQCESRHNDCKQFKIVATGGREDGHIFPPGMSIVSSEDGEMMGYYKLVKVKRKSTV